MRQKKIRIQKLVIDNIRNFEHQEIDFTTRDFSLFMMPNGVGKTTIINLIKSTLIGNDYFSNKSIVRSFRPLMNDKNEGKVFLIIQIDDKTYNIHLTFNFKFGEVKYEYGSKAGGGTSKDEPYELGIFSSDFVDKFIFDGELVEAFLNSESNYTAQSLRSIFHFERLDKLYSAIETAKSSLIDQNITRASKQTGVTQCQNEIDQLQECLDKLLDRKKELEEAIKKNRNAIQRMSDSKNKIIDKDNKVRETIEAHKRKEIQLTSDLDKVMTSIAQNSFFIHTSNKSLWESNKSIVDALVNLELPRSMSKQFFVDLYESAEYCICGKKLDKKDREFIENNYDKYLSENNISFLNSIKNNTKYIDFDSNLRDGLEEADKLDEKITEIQNKIQRATSKLKTKDKEEVNQLVHDIKKLEKNNVSLENEYSKITETDPTELKTISEGENVALIRKHIEQLKEKRNIIEGNKMIDDNSQVLCDIINSVSEEFLERIKNRIVSDTNKLLRHIIQDDDIQIKEIRSSLEIQGRSGVSYGQKLSIAYAFISQLFKNSFYDLPFIIDSPCGRLDFDRRPELAKVIPEIFGQLAIFLIPPEREGFVEVFSEKYDTRTSYTTIHKKLGDLVTSYIKADFMSLQAEKSNGI